MTAVQPEIYPAIGNPIFEKIISSSIYVDKTHLIYQILTSPDEYFFLSRPRRFGKSLLVSTFKALFSGKRELFENLWIDSSNYQWPVHPIIHLDFSSFGKSFGADLELALIKKMLSIALEYKIEIDPSYHTEPSILLNELIEQLKRKCQANVVILIDEYDKPVLNVIGDFDNATVNRDILSGFFSTIKANGENIHFVFLTGVSKLAKASVFSALNNLVDLSMKEKYAAICGYTLEEVKHYFTPHIAYAAEKMKLSIEEFLDKLQTWYNGYRFSDAEVKVFNPVACHNCLTDCKFLDTWFATATPTFLINLIKQQEYPIQNLEKGEKIGIDLFQPCDIENIPLVPLLFQSGYLTIQQYNFEDQKYILSYPNFEVKQSFEKHLAIHFLGRQSTILDAAIREMNKTLQAGNIERFIHSMREFFSQIPYKIQIASERYYHSVFFIISRMLNLNAFAEVETNEGRVDLIIKTAQTIYLFEFKFQKEKSKDEEADQKLAEKALLQIKEQNYFQPFLREKKPIIAIGAVFSFTARNLTAYQVEKINS